ncbi:MAG: hypothetical protein SFY81_09365 [Verrucomicrobiota bacterium]|nr:hypothetical protein [Verrucomicrobiota bacterium]
MRRTQKKSGASAAPRSKRLRENSDQSAAKNTTRLEEIQQWAEARGGCPSTVKGTGDKEEPGLLRIDFPGYSGKKSLIHISWEEWYEKFRENDLSFLYQEKTKTGRPSRFFKLISKK